MADITSVQLTGLQSVQERDDINANAAAGFIMADPAAETADASGLAVSDSSSVSASDSGAQPAATAATASPDISADAANYILNYQISSETEPYTFALKDTGTGADDVAADYQTIVDNLAAGQSAKDLLGQVLADYAGRQGKPVAELTTDDISAAVEQYVNGHITYQWEDKDSLADMPALVASLLKGEKVSDDCEEFAVLTAALLKTAGLDAELGFIDSDGNKEIDHVVVIVGDRIIDSTDLNSRLTMADIVFMTAHGQDGEVEIVDRDGNRVISDDSINTHGTPPPTEAEQMTAILNSVGQISSDIDDESFKVAHCGLTREEWADLLQQLTDAGQGAVAAALDLHPENTPEVLDWLADPDTYWTNLNDEATQDQAADWLTLQGVKADQYEQGVEDRAWSSYHDDFKIMEFGAGLDGVDQAASDDANADWEIITNRLDTYVVNTLGWTRAGEMKVDSDTTYTVYQTGAQAVTLSDGTTIPANTYYTVQHYNYADPSKITLVAVTAAGGGSFSAPKNWKDNYLDVSYLALGFTAADRPLFNSPAERYKGILEEFLAEGPDSPDAVGGTLGALAIKYLGLQPTGGIGFGPGWVMTDPKTGKFYVINSSGQYPYYDGSDPKAVNPGVTYFEVVPDYVDGSGVQYYKKVVPDTTQTISLDQLNLNPEELNRLRSVATREDEIKVQDTLPPDQGGSDYQYRIGGEIEEKIGKPNGILYSGTNGYWYGYSKTGNNTYLIGWHEGHLLLVDQAHQTETVLDVAALTGPPYNMTEQDAKDFLALFDSVDVRIGKLHTANLQRVGILKSDETATKDNPIWDPKTGSAKGLAADWLDSGKMFLKFDKDTGYVCTKPEFYLILKTMADLYNQLALIFYLVEGKDELRGLVMEIVTDTKREKGKTSAFDAALAKKSSSMATLNYLTYSLQNYVGTHNNQVRQAKLDQAAKDAYHESHGDGWWDSWEGWVDTFSFGKAGLRDSKEQALYYEKKGQIDAAYDKFEKRSQAECEKALGKDFNYNTGDPFGSAIDQVMSELGLADFTVAIGGGKSDIDRTGIVRLRDKLAGLENRRKLMYMLRLGANKLREEVASAAGGREVSAGADGLINASLQETTQFEQQIFGLLFNQFQQ
ncbi:MAG TPA: hypothetical protein VMT55_00545, partial [Candidatus Sulfotelmatobacter sp.]|nr:hypothetical protein [Candidatus Sulfotelmatobacter sp.]